MWPGKQETDELTSEWHMQPSEDGTAGSGARRIFSFVSAVQPVYVNGGQSQGNCQTEWVHARGSCGGRKGLSVSVRLCGGGSAERTGLWERGPQAEMKPSFRAHRRRFS